MPDLTEEAITAEIDAFRRVWPNADHGPGHIVIADLNIEPGHIAWVQGFLCAVRFLRADPAAYAGHSDAELEATGRLLDWIEQGGVPRTRVVPEESGPRMVQERWQDVTRSDAEDR